MSTALNVQVGLETFVPWTALDTANQPIGGLTGGDFTLSLTLDGVVSAVPVTVTELSPGPTGSYEFRFTPDALGTWILDVTPNYQTFQGGERHTRKATTDAPPDLSSTLCTADQVKEYLGRYEAGDTEDDALLAALCSRVTEYIQKRTGRWLFSRQETEVGHVNWRPNIILREQPVASVSSVHVSTGVPRVYDASTLLDPDNYVLDAGMVKRIDGGVFPPYPQAVQVVYTAGYDPIPHDLNWAAVRLSALWLLGRRYVGISTHSLADGSVTTFDSESVPWDITQIIDRYTAGDRALVL